MKHEILPEEEVAAILEDARDTLKKMPENTKTPELQAVMARLANSLAAGAIRNQGLICRSYLD